MHLILFFSLQPSGFDAFNLNFVAEHNMTCCSASEVTLQAMRGGQQLATEKQKMNWLASFWRTTSGGHGSVVMAMVSS